MPSPILAAGALLIEAAAGYPAALLARAGHPVMWAGAAIAWLDRRLNRGRARRAKGVGAMAGLLLAAGLAAWGVQSALLATLPRSAALAVLALLASSLLAQRSLHAHVRAVADALEQGLPAAREAVSHIVGRDPESLDGAAIARAAIESLAENFSDGVLAPALWCLLAGLPGMVVYKVANTADSMIGHRTPRHEAFGWAAARLDDLLNLPAARLSALVLALASRRPRLALRTAWRDAPGHRSPNAGWPEAAMAAALGLRLAGPRRYGGVAVADGWMGDGTPAATAADVRRALALYRRACALLAAAMLAAMLAALGLP